MGAPICWLASPASDGITVPTPAHGVYHGPFGINKVFIFRTVCHSRSWLHETITEHPQSHFLQAGVEREPGDRCWQRDVRRRAGTLRNPPAGRTRQIVRMTYRGARELTALAADTLAKRSDAGDAVFVKGRPDSGRIGILGPVELMGEEPGGDPPRTATKTLQNYVLRVRRTLAQAKVATIATQPDGYCLRAASDATDAGLAESLIAAGRREMAGGDPAAAARLLGQALVI